MKKLPKPLFLMFLSFTDWLFQNSLTFPWLLLKFQNSLTNFKIPWPWKNSFFSDFFPDRGHPDLQSTERGAIAEWLEQLDYGVESRRKVRVQGLALPRGDWKTLCQPSSKWVPFFELGKDMAAQGEGWALPFISCAQDIVGL